MDKFMNRLRIQEFQNNYDINPSLLDDQERLFRFEETQTMIWNEIARPVYVFALTDVILVTYINVPYNLNVLGSRTVRAV